MSEKPTYHELEKTVQKMQTAEALHKHELKALHKSENRYRTILQTANDGFWITDINGHFLEVNLAYAQMSGYSQDELLTMQISDIEANEYPVAVKEHIKSGLKKRIRPLSITSPQKR